MKDDVDQFKEREAAERENVEKAEANFTSVQAGWKRVARRGTYYWGCFILLPSDSFLNP